MQILVWILYDMMNCTKFCLPFVTSVGMIIFRTFHWLTPPPTPPHPSNCFLHLHQRMFQTIKFIRGWPRLSDAKKNYSGLIQLLLTEVNLKSQQLGALWDTETRSYVTKLTIPPTTPDAYGDRLVVFILLDKFPVDVGWSQNFVDNKLQKPVHREDVTQTGNHIYDPHQHPLIPSMAFRHQTLTTLTRKPTAKPQEGDTLQRQPEGPTSQWLVEMVTAHNVTFFDWPFVSGHSIADQHQVQDGCTPDSPRCTIYLPFPIMLSFWIVSSCWYAGVKPVKDLSSSGIDIYYQTLHKLSISFKQQSSSAE